jgi:hypothetical protein
MEINSKGCKDYDKANCDAECPVRTYQPRRPDQQGMQGDGRRDHKDDQGKETTTTETLWTNN